MTLSQSQVKLLNISQFAKVCRTTPRTLRFYEQKGLIKPYKIDHWNDYRFYHPDQARNFLNIKLLQNFNITLNQIKPFLRKNSINNSLDGHVKALQKEIIEKQKEIKFLKDIKSLLFNDKVFQSRLKPKTIGPYHLFCIKINHASYHKINEYIIELWKAAKSLGLDCKPYEITFYIDNKFKPTDIPLEIALICKDISKIKKDLPKNYYFKNYPKTKINTFDYHGPYEYLPLIYQNFYDHLDKLKFTNEEKNKVFEIYIRGPLNTKSKYDYLTRIGFPVKWTG